MLTRIGAGCNKGCFDVTEATLAVFGRLGFPPDQAAHLSLQALWTLVSLVGSEPGAPQPGLGADDQAEKERSRRATFLSPAPARYPRLIAAAPALTRCEEPDAFYGLGLEVFLAGVARLAESQPARWKTCRRTPVYITCSLFRLSDSRGGSTCVPFGGFSWSPQ
ncbi:MAG TPA: TetR/AcrR family transcriptional regulator C-terminal domain-containing protein [Actinocrinis sp.]|nr:TetR/AcrR family transcriptional regulator C-terminal domain-containing protein [Actinocrinis sp.]